MTHQPADPSVLEVDTPLTAGGLLLIVAAATAEPHFANFPMYETNLKVITFIQGQ